MSVLSMNMPGIKEIIYSLCLDNYQRIAGYTEEMFREEFAGWNPHEEWPMDYPNLTCVNWWPGGHTGSPDDPTMYKVMQYANAIPKDLNFGCVNWFTAVADPTSLHDGYALTSLPSDCYHGHLVCRDIEYLRVDYGKFTELNVMGPKLQRLELNCGFSGADQVQAKSSTFNTINISNTNISSDSFTANFHSMHHPYRFFVISCYNTPFQEELLKIYKLYLGYMGTRDYDYGYETDGIIWNIKGHINFPREAIVVFRFGDPLMGNHLRLLCYHPDHRPDIAFMIDHQ